MGENGWRVYFAIFAILLWVGLVMLAIVAIVEVSTGAAAEAAAGDYIRSVSRAEIGEIARKAAHDTASDSGPTAKDWAEGIQAAVTAAGILVAGGWAFYVFFLGRSSVGVVQVLIEPKGLTTSGDHTGAVISVTVKNVGRASIGKTGARIRAVPITEGERELLLEEKEGVTTGVMPAAVPPGGPTEISTVLFGGRALTALEPGQETSEEVVIILGAEQVARVEALFVGGVRPLFREKERTFSSRIYLDMAALEAAEENPTTVTILRSEKSAQTKEKEK